MSDTFDGTDAPTPVPMDINQVTAQIVRQAVPANGPDPEAEGYEPAHIDYVVVADLVVVDADGKKVRRRKYLDGAVQAAMPPAIKLGFKNGMDWLYEKGLFRDGLGPDPDVA